MTLDDQKSWSIKNMPQEPRNAAMAAAKRRRMHMAEWLATAILNQIKAEQGESRDLVPVSAGSVAPSGAEGRTDHRNGGVQSAFEAMEMIQRAAAVAKDVAEIGEGGAGIQRLLLSRLRSTMTEATQRARNGRGHTGGDV